MITTVGEIGLKLVLNSSGFSKSLNAVQEQANSVSNKMSAKLKNSVQRLWLLFRLQLLRISVSSALNRRQMLMPQIRSLNKHLAQCSHKLKVLLLRYLKTVVF